MLNFLLQSCQSDTKIQALEIKEPQYSLRLGEKTDLGKEWGVRYEVFVDSQTATDLTDSRLAFWGYDLDGDGRFELIEQIDEKGQVIRRGYDLDFDGVLDSIDPK